MWKGKYKSRNSYKVLKEQYMLSPIMSVREFFMTVVKVQHYSGKATTGWSMEKQAMLRGVKEKFDDPKEMQEVVEEKLTNAVVNETDDRAMMRASQILNNAMYAVIMEVNKHIDYKEINGKKTVTGIKCKIAEFRSILEELRIFAKMPKYYSPAKPWGLDDDDDPIQTDESDGSLVNALWVVQIVLTDEKEEDVLSELTDEANKNVPEAVDDIQTLDRQ